MIARHWGVVVVGGRIAGASTAWALAPYAESVLVVDASNAGAFWPQQSTWDRQGNLAWDRLGLLDAVLACGAPRTYGHTYRTGTAVVEHDYPQVDRYAFRMSVPREVLDPALLRTACGSGNVTVLRPARVRELVRDADRVRGAVVRHDGADHTVTCDLLVLADGRGSRCATWVGAQPYRMVRSPWTSLLAYFEDLPVPADRSYFSMGEGSILICTPCGPRQWCVSTAIHQRLIDAVGEPAVRVFGRLLEQEPHLGPAVRAGRRTTPIGGAGKLRMLRRPMSGPGWCLVGDSGYHMDPVTAQGTRNALVAAAILRDRVAELGQVDGAALAGLTEQRDSALDEEWIQTEAIVNAPG